MDASTSQPYLCNSMYLDQICPIRERTFPESVVSIENQKPVLIRSCWSDLTRSLSKKRVRSDLKHVLRTGPWSFADFWAYSLATSESHMLSIKQFSMHQIEYHLRSLLVTRLKKISIYCSSNQFLIIIKEVNLSPGLASDLQAVSL